MHRSIHRLLFVTDAPLFGGAEQYIASMAAAASHRGITPSICWIKPPDAQVFESWRQQSIVVHAIDSNRIGSMAALWRELRSVMRIERPDAAIINASGRRRFWLSSWIARRQGVPAAWVHHMVDSNDYRRLAPRRFGGRVEGLHLWRLPQAARHRLAATGATTIVTLNERDREQVAREQAIPPGSISTIGNGVDTHRYHYDADIGREIRAGWMHSRPRLGPLDAFVVGTAGRLVSGKGVPLLIEAAAMLRRRQVPMFLVVAGNGPEREALAVHAARLGVAESVLFVGFTSDMPAFYSGLDAFALCSSTESFGLVLAEAHACERAVIATPTAGAAVQITHGVDGLLLKSFTAAELAEALFKLYSQPIYREQLGRQGRARVVETFSIERTLSRMLDLLRTASVSKRRSHVEPDLRPGLAGGGAA